MAGRATVASVVLALLLGLSTSPAGAAVLPVEIEAALEIATLAPLRLESTGSATLNGSGSGGHLTAAALAAAELVDSTVVPITDPGAAPITGVSVAVANAAGSVTETVGGVVRGAIGLMGAAKVCLFGDGGCAGTIGNITVPLSIVGAGGSQFATGPVNLTVFGAPWATGQVAIGTITRIGIAHGPLSGTSSTALPGGVLQLVTPLRISTNIGASAVVPIFATMTLRFVPEPTTIVLLGCGVGALGLAGARRR